MSLMMKIVRTMVKRSSRGFFDSDSIDAVKVRATMAVMLQKNAKQQKIEPGVTVGEDVIDGVQISLVTPASWNGRDVIYYVHGGGLITGDHMFAVPYASQLANASKCRVVSVNYRLAPENPFPAGLDDVYAVYKHLANKHRVALIGESGGAYLSVALTLKLKQNGEELPRSIVINSIVADLSGKIPRKNLKTETTVTVEGADKLGRLYAPDMDLTDPLVSVVYGDFGGFPPVRVICDDGEVLRPDSEAVYEKLKTAGCDATLKMYHDTFHAFTTTGKATPESKAELEASTTFIASHFSKA